VGRLIVIANMKAVNGGEDINVSDNIVGLPVRLTAG
jgi:hypothetical protein